MGNFADQHGGLITPHTSPVSTAGHFSIGHALGDNNVAPLASNSHLLIYQVGIGISMAHRDKEAQGYMKT